VGNVVVGVVEEEKTTTPSKPSMPGGKVVI